MESLMERRQFIRKSIALGGATYLSQFSPLWVSHAIAAETNYSNSVDLRIAQTPFEIDGRKGSAITVNGQLPAPLLRWQEGSTVTLRVTNTLNVDTSIHWHGILLPFQMDGVPGVSFPGIRPNETFTYTFPIKQSGTYWYHSHSGLQEQEGLYGPIIIDPAKPDPITYDREYIIVLSDWSFESAHRIFSKLKKMSDNYNFQKRTIKDFSRNLQNDGFVDTVENRLMWGDMRMDPTDISDVTASTYSYLLNGKSSAANWTALFQEGDRVRFRIINASAMTIFNFRIPDLPMTVVQADGLNVQPIEVDEFQIGVAETYDFVASPNKERAYTIMAESIDRSGYVRGTLAPRPGMSAEVPALRARPLLTMRDMGMKHDMHSPQTTDDKHAHHHHGHDTGMTKGVEHQHPTGPGVMNVAHHPSRRLDEPGLGLEDVPHRVLVYTDLKSLAPNPDLRAAEREITLHLTSNMERYMWSFDGKKFSESPEPIAFFLGERLRLTMINDTMMSHPIHLHGMFFELVTGDPTHRPRKHTVIVKPAEILSVEITADAYGDWAFHCHLLYHMHAGMMRVVSIREREHA
jgi:CopA family copper-resistance protein